MAIRQYKAKRALKTVAAVAATGILAVIAFKMLFPLFVTVGIAALVVWLIIYALRS